MVSLTLKAAPDVNPDAGGSPKPVRVRVYKLKTGQPFSEADFFVLDKDPAGVLGGDLVGFDEFVLPPGGTQVWQAKLEDDVRVIGITAAYFAVDQAQWRAWKEVPPNATTLLVAEIGPSAVALREAGL